MRPEASRRTSWRDGLTEGALEGVLAGESSITFLDGLADPSVLEYRGYNIHDIAETTSFEEIAYLVLEGQLPNKAQLRAFEDELKAARARLLSDDNKPAKRNEKLAEWDP